MLGTDEGKTTLNLRLETFGKKEKNLLAISLLQHLTLCTKGLCHSLSHFFFLKFFTVFSLKVTFCLFQSLGLLQISRTSAEIFSDKVNV